MALDVIPTPIPHYAVNQYLDKLDQRSEVYSFIASVRSPKIIDLQLNRDGADDALTIKLSADGTWTAEHVLVIGEKV